MNLLSNAAKFTPANGDIRLEARLTEETATNCTIEFKVADNGIGISEAQQAQLFRPFQQADSSTSRHFGGTGLGLAISKRIVEMMDGQIIVESELDQGSVFRFTVKIAKGTPTKPSELSPNVNWKDISLLLVDNDLSTREYFEELQNKYGLTYEAAVSGKDAMLFLEQGICHDLCFIEYTLPDMNGVELAGHIKKRCADESTVIMISSAEWNIVYNDAKAAGVEHFVPKPLFLADIIDCINSCISHTAPTAELPVTSAQNVFTGNRLLLAEDVEINREIVLELLEPTGIEIDCAENGAKALELFSANPDRYDMILMDLQMPKMDGFEATRLIRTLDAPKAKTIPIIAMTANVFKEDIEKCLAAGMNDHAGKPLDMEVLLSKLRRFLPEHTD